MRKIEDPPIKKSIRKINKALQKHTTLELLLNEEYPHRKTILRNSKETVTKLCMITHKNTFVTIKKRIDNRYEKYPTKLGKVLDSILKR